ncbi:MAG: hypothetical protein QGG40_21055, partial [Myxococcota bacterium]|nr:hypothetical protein [Myxococcota bacterium]
MLWILAASQLIAPCSAQENRPAPDFDAQTAFDLLEAAVQASGDPTAQLALLEAAMPPRTEEEAFRSVGAAWAAAQLLSQRDIVDPTVHRELLGRALLGDAQARKDAVRAAREDDPKGIPQEPWPGARDLLRHALALSDQPEAQAALIHGALPDPDHEESFRAVGAAWAISRALGEQDERDPETHRTLFTQALLGDDLDRQNAVKRAREKSQPGPAADSPPAEESHPFPGAQDLWTRLVANHADPGTQQSILYAALPKP